MQNSTASKSRTDLGNMLNALRSKVSNIICNGLHSNNPKSAIDKYLYRLMDVTTAFIRDNPEIIIVKSDKGNKTVIMWRADYESKMRSLLTNGEDYTEQEGDKTTGYERQKNEIVRELRERKCIDERTKRVLTTYNTRAPAIYGLPKIHKPGAPLRPIVSCVQSPMNGISQFLSLILKNISNMHEYNVKDSFMFVERIQKVVVPPDYIMGLPMGGPLSPIAADIIMDLALKTIVDSLDFPLVCLTKYADDIFCLIPKDRVEETLQVFNGFHPTLQFTVEVEVNGGLPYLDTFVLRGVSTLDIVWYKKPTSSPRMLNYVSKHPLQLKVATAVGFIQRVSKLTTTNRNNMRISIFTQLRINNYPSYLIHSLLDRHLKGRTSSQLTPKPIQ
uniref:Reverse transcriptase domain-containing protein n=1 Tax=Phlebotomus papatasi TaxID=29031 RepID=A0A1B0DHJ8_PHLPP